MNSTIAPFLLLRYVLLGERAKLTLLSAKLVLLHQFMPSEEQYDAIINNDL
jgi:hypothetical protein